MQYTWLLFDADDTLFNYPLAEANALQRTFVQMGAVFGPETLELYHKFNQQVWGEFERGELTSTELRTKRFRLLFDATDSSLAPELFSQVYLQNLALGTDLLPGAEETLTTLGTRYHLALVTNGLADVQRPRLERSVLSGRFERVFISEEIGAAKPESAFFDAVFCILGRPSKTSVLIIGDSLTSDMQGGLKYGIDTCWYNPTGKYSELPVTYQVRQLVELLDWL